MENDDKRGPGLGPRIALLLIPLIIAGASIGLYYVYSTYQEVQSVMTDVFVTPVVPETPEPDAPAVTFPDWDKKERVNILLLGLDLRPDEIPRSDTMILISIDPANKTAVMLSIPRDLWVTIPGYGENRINAAYTYGEMNDLPGGGPYMAKKTVAANFDVPVHYFATIDLQGFEKLVDAVGGVTLDVERPLRDDEYPTEDFGYTRFYIPAGLQHMDGITALRYARSRHADSDLGRNQRQQEVLMAIRQQGLRFDLITKLPEMMQALRGTLKTDLSFTQVGSLASLSRDIRTENIEKLAIDSTMVTPFVTAEGADVLLPDWPAIRELTAKLFTESVADTEEAAIVVQNGTFINGLASRVAAAFTEKGLNVISVEQAPDAGNFPKTVIYDFTGKPQTVKLILEQLELDESQVRESESSRPGVDIMVILGPDIKIPGED